MNNVWELSLSACLDWAFVKLAVQQYLGVDGFCTKGTSPIHAVKTFFGEYVNLYRDELYLIGTCLP